MKYKKEIIAGVIILIILVIAFAFGGSTKQKKEHLIPASKTTVESVKEEAARNTEKPISTAYIENKENVTQAENSPKPNEKPQKADNTPMTAEEKIEYAEKYFETNNTSSDTQSDIDTNNINGNTNTQENNPKPVDPENIVISDTEKFCTLSVRCDTILDNISWLDKEKIGIIPKNGIIYPEQQVVFYEGESVFNLLLREMKKNKIHMEFVNTPIYNSAYIEGIGNLYEFDCGELSGWMYKVNDWFPNYGCSQYIIHEGDKIEWVYSCNLGADVGGNYSTKNGSD